MRSVCSRPVRQAARTMLVLGALLAWAAPASAQGFGFGARFAWVTRDADDDVDVDVDDLRFIGGQMRLLSARFGRRGLSGPPFRVVRAPQPEGHGDADTGVAPDAAGPAAGFLHFCWAGQAGIAARSRQSTALEMASARRSSAGMPASASRSGLANISASTVITATRSSTSATMTTTTRDSSVGYFRGTGLNVDPGSHCLFLGPASAPHGPSRFRSFRFYRAASGSKVIRRRVRVARAKRSSASVDGRTLPLSTRAI